MSTHGPHPPRVCSETLEPAAEATLALDPGRYFAQHAGDGGEAAARTSGADVAVPEVKTLSHPFFAQ